MQLKSQDQLDAITGRQFGNLTKTRKQELLATAQSAAANGRLDELLGVANADESGFTADEKKFFAELVTDDPAAQPGGAINGQPPAPAQAVTPKGPSTTAPLNGSGPAK